MQSPIKIHGGKGMLAPRLLPLVPQHTTYFEPFAGGASLFFAKSGEDVNEVLCDANREISNLYEVLQNPIEFERFRRLVEMTPFGQDSFEDSRVMSPTHSGLIEYAGALVVRAVNFFIQSRMSMSGRREVIAPISLARRRRGMNEQVSAWLTAVDGLPEVHKRLRRAYVMNGDGIATISKFDIPDCFIYADPPYHPSTRSSTGEYGDHEMSHEDHCALLGALSGLKHAKFMLSGYRCELYDQAQEENQWQRIDFPVKNHSGTGSTKQDRVESVWLNYDPSESPA